MPSIDTKKFPQVPFPASYASDFRVHFDPDTYRQIEEHVKKDTSHEVGGILVGVWQKDENGPYATVTAMIRCDKAVGKEGEVTFTHETWNDIAREMDGPYVDLQIIGWYHSHPGFGVFLSERDMFIQEHFFSNPGQIALVIDPIAETNGVFYWKKDKVVVSEYFWIGKKLSVSRPEDADPTQHPKTKRYASSESGDAEATSNRPAPLLDNSWFSVLIIVTLCMLMFVLGGLFKKEREFARHERILEGAIYDYYLAAGGKRPGLEDALAAVGQDVQQAKMEVKKLSEGDKETKPVATAEQLAALDGQLNTLQKRLDKIRAIYCLSKREKLGILELIAYQLNAELKAEEEAKEKSSKKTEPKKTEPKKTEPKKEPQKKEPAKKEPVKQPEKKQPKEDKKESP